MRYHDRLHRRGKQDILHGFGLVQNVHTYKPPVGCQTESIGQGEKSARWLSLTNGFVGIMQGVKRRVKIGRAHV